MIISWYGLSCFKIQDKTGLDGITIITDPFDQKCGLKMPSVDADIVTLSHLDHANHNNLKAVRGDFFVVKNPGEYDVKGIIINGVDSYHDEKKGEDLGKNTIYRIEIDGITVTHLGDLGHVLNSDELEILSGTDILLVPIGGRHTLNAKKAVEVVNQIEPRIVIPMHYSLPGLKITDIDGLDKFTKELGIKPTEEQKLKISSKELPQEDMELVVLNI